MESRRDFIKKAAVLTGTAAVWGVLPESIRKAVAIDPAEGSTYLDAEHVVILMQENRSFDHCFGTLQGVRGFNDPRAMRLADGKPVWLQTNPAGDTYAPFRLDIKGTKATWMGSLPHSWTNQVDARNHGRYDKWLTAKPSGNSQYAKMPLTLGHYTREDIPFYYAFADAFTVCDQHFCSSLTGTTPNRLYLWTGTIRAKNAPDSLAHVNNEEVDYGREASWTTYPERLEDHGISWKIYQNEISLDSGFQGEEDSWLSNFTDNPIEWFTQFNVRHGKGHQGHLERSEAALVATISKLEGEEKSASGDALTKIQSDLKAKRAQLDELKATRAKWSKENFDKLSERSKNLHRKAFSDNSGDPHYRDLTDLTYQDGETTRTVQVPKGDILHQFRKDVATGNLPTVSWIVGPENFSDHPGAAWYGAWYVSEVLDVLTQNPEVWKKTIFILTYDENDGYFDHVPPFVFPNPANQKTGQVSESLKDSAEFVDLEQDKKHRPGHSARESSIGLGYRVPLVIASPWSRGGCVCSEVFDHTSSLQFLEHFLERKTGKKVIETNITPWRRAVCGDLTSAFQPYNGEKTDVPSFPPRDEFIETIHKAMFKGLPSGYKGLNAEEIAGISKNPATSALMSSQEKGTRKSAPLPYDLHVDGGLVRSDTLGISLTAGKAGGAPFNAYAYTTPGNLEFRSFAVTAGDTLQATWSLVEFEGQNYHVRVDGPNGFLREFKGSPKDPSLAIQVGYARTGGSVEIQLENHGSRALEVEIHDESYGAKPVSKAVAAGAKAKIVVSNQKTQGWYDFTLKVAGEAGFERRCAGRVETGRWGITDPAMARSLS